MTSQPEPYRTELAARFLDEGVVEAYQYRPPYPPEVFAILNELIRERPRAVLDVGCGRGELARPLLDLAERVDAVDRSPAMIAKGRTLPGGGDPRLRWISSRVEEAALDPPYALIVGGDSLHWMDWDVVMPLFAGVLSPHGSLALVSRRATASRAGGGAEDRQEPAGGLLPGLPWAGELAGLIRQFMTHPEYHAVDVFAAWQGHGLFEKRGERRTAPWPFAQSVDDFVAELHSRSYLARAAMSPAAAAQFDAEVKRLLADHCPAGVVEFEVIGEIIWGRPRRPARLA